MTDSTTFPRRFIICCTFAIVAACRDDVPTAPDSPTVVAPQPLNAIASPAPQISAVPGDVKLPIEVRTVRRPATSGDFGIGRDVANATAIGTPSLIWYATDGSATIWKMNGAAFANDGATVLQIPDPWRLMTTADLNADSHPDFIWQSTGGMIAVTYMNGAGYAGSYAMMFQIPAEWRIVTAVDYDRNGQSDLLLLNTSNGNIGVLYMNGAAWTGNFNYLPYYPTDWRPVAAADMNGDNNVDIIIQHNTSGVFFVMRMTGINYLSNGPGYNEGANGRVAALADFDFDGQSDLVWQDLVSGDRRILIMNGSNYTGQKGILPNVSSAHSVVATARIRWTVAPLNLSISGFTLTQSVQSLGGTIPLVAGRSALFRGFISANDINDAATVVRVRVIQTGGSTTILNATRNVVGGGVPMGLNQAILGSSYNVTIPAALINAGMSVQVEVDPDNLVAETNEADNIALAAVNVVSVTRFDIRFIPVHLANGEVDNVTPSYVPVYMGMTMKIWPLLNYDADVHAVYNSPRMTMSIDTAWYGIFNEIAALRVAEGNPPRYYHGTMPRISASAFGGLGSLGYPVALSLGMMNATDSSIGDVAAHELGHNFNRPHSPGCGAAGPDPGYPTETGLVDMYGYDASAPKVHSPSASYDIMSYCGPKWVAGYSFTQVLNFRALGGAPAPLSSAQVPSVLVWGRIDAQGNAQLEPGFDIMSRPDAGTGGDYRIEAVDGSGSVLYSQSIVTTEIADAHGGERSFAMAMPLSSFDARRMRGLRLVDKAGRQVAGMSSRSAATPGVPGIPDFVIEKVGAEKVLRWSDSQYPMAMVKDAATGEVIGFGRNGRLSLKSDAGEMEVHFSNGVRSTSRRQQLQ